MILHDSSTIIRERQLAMRREMDRRGILLKVVAQDSGIPYSTLLSYFPAEGSREPAVMPTSAQYDLAGKIPDDLLSLLLPAGRTIVQVPDGIDFDGLADSFTEFLHAKNAAHHPESEAGRELGPNEQAELAAKVVHLPLGRVA